MVVPQLLARARAQAIGARRVIWGYAPGEANSAGGCGYASAIVHMPITTGGMTMTFHVDGYSGCTRGSMTHEAKAISASNGVSRATSPVPLRFLLETRAPTCRTPVDL